MPTSPETSLPPAAAPDAGRRATVALALWTGVVLLVLTGLGLRRWEGGAGAVPEVLRFAGTASGPGSPAERLAEGLRLAHFTLYPAYPWLLFAPYVFRIARRHPFEPARWIRGTLIWALVVMAWVGAAAGFRSWSAFTRPDLIVLTRLEVEETRTTGGDGAPGTGTGTETSNQSVMGTATNPPAEAWWETRVRGVHGKGGGPPPRLTAVLSNLLVQAKREEAIRATAGVPRGGTQVLVRAEAVGPDGGATGGLPGIGAGEEPIRLPWFEGGMASWTSILLDVLACASIAGVAHARQFHRESRARERRALALETSLTQARLHALQSQLQPHFLFNTLNSVTAMLREDPRVAEEMLVSLSDLLRWVLSESTRQESTLREDLRFVELYVEIQQYRFGATLRFQAEVPSELWGCRVPRLLLQPLVENAIRHGLEPAGRPVTIRVTAFRPSDARLVLVVEDDGVGRRTPAEDPPGPGLGLANVRARLSACFGPDATMTLPERPAGGGFAVRLEIPFRPDAGGTEAVPASAHGREEVGS